jgi:hypothetical protein
MDATSENNTHVSCNPLSLKSNWAEGKRTFLFERMNTLWHDNVDSLFQNNDAN